MRSERLYQLLDPGASGAAQAFRVVHHAMVAAGIRRHDSRYRGRVSVGLVRRARCRVLDRLRLLCRRVCPAADRCTGGAGSRGAPPMAHALGLGRLDGWALRSARNAAWGARGCLRSGRREPSRLCLGFQAHPLRAGTCRAATRDQRCSERPAIGSPRLLHRSACLCVPCLFDRARDRSRRCSARSPPRCGGRL